MTSSSRATDPTALPVPDSFNLADLWEAVSARVEDRCALVCGRQRRTYGELARRTNQLARHLRSAGIEPGEHIALYLRNGAEYVETMLAAFTVRAVPVNVNFRYVADELRYLLTDSESVALVVHRSLLPAAAEVLASLPAMRTVLVVDDQPQRHDAAGDEIPAAIPGAVPYEAALAGQATDRLAVPGRSDDDHYLMYTGGTTGMPKGVLWRQADAFFGCLGGGDPGRASQPISSPSELPDRMVEHFVYLTVAPLMHAAAQWTSLMWLFAGGTVVLIPGALDAEEVWQAVQDEGVNQLTVVGDAVGRPLVTAWEKQPNRWDVSALAVISNGGAPISPALKSHIAELFPQVVVADGFGSSESGVQGAGRKEAGDDGRARFHPRAGTTVFDDDLRPVRPGSGATGRVANTGPLPLGYLNDPEKTAATFIEVAGRRYCFTGDVGTVEADGTIVLLGRGSQSINTGGEKVFPEEVEGALLAQQSVRDVLVVGVPDERWGSAVTAVVAPSDPAAPPTLEGLRSALRTQLAGYKLPKHLVLTDAVVRSPAGKPDYPWATELAESQVAGRG